MSAGATPTHSGSWVLGVGGILAMPHGQLVLGDPIGDVGDDLLDDLAVDEPQRVELRVGSAVSGGRVAEERPRVVPAHPEAERHSGAVGAGELVEQGQAQPGKPLVELLDEWSEGSRPGRPQAIGL